MQTSQKRPIPPFYVDTRKAQSVLSARATTVLDEVTAELAHAKIPWRPRGAVRHRKAPMLDRVIVEALRRPLRDMFGDPTEGDALDIALRTLVERHRLFWRHRAVPEEERPAVYSFLHCSGVAVIVLARGKL